MEKMMNFVQDFYFMYSIAAIRAIINAELIQGSDPEQSITHLVYDSRKISSPKESLFFALKGQRDGHHYLQDAYNKGVRSFVVQQAPFWLQQDLTVNLLQVSGVLEALQSLARYHREQYTNLLIGITGSNGKTVVKEWLSSLLEADINSYQSPKSYNSQLGVALSLWNLTNEHKIAFIEAGISQVGEMQKLAELIQPKIGVFTNIGMAHAEGFITKAEKIKEKMKLFAHAETLIFPSKYDLEAYVPAACQVFSWGEKSTDRLRLMHSAETANQQTLVDLVYEEASYQIALPFRDRASVENGITCIATLLYLGYSFAEIIPKVALLKPVEMRLQLKKGKHNCSIIDDTYSNDLGSLQIALEFLNQQQQHPKRSLILSDMEGLAHSPKMFAKLQNLLNGQHFNKLVLIGTFMQQHQAAFLRTTAVFATTADFLEQIDSLAFDQESILIKGGRSFHLEDVSDRLAALSHETVLEINLNALENNLQAYRSLLPPGVKLMAMVKAFSYGSGSFEVANLLQFNQVDYLTVAFVDEGVELRTGGISLPIMVLSPDERAFEMLVRHALEPEIYSFRILKAFVAYLQSQGKAHYPIHIKVDTGMHRLGFLPEELEALTNYLKDTTAVYAQSIFSHLVASGDENHANFTVNQIHILRTFAQNFEQVMGYTVLKHIANTSAIIKWPSAYMDMVRLGIGLYGVDMDSSSIGLAAVSTLKTTITQIKTLPAGETVGYDRKGKILRESQIATVKIGYADGYDRRFGLGVGQMMINGHLAPTIGNICMDMCMLDVTDIPAQEEDEVFVFPDIKVAAQSIGTIPYELLVNISSRVKRVYFYE